MVKYLILIIVGLGLAITACDDSDVTVKEAEPGPTYDEICCFDAGVDAT